MRYLICAILVWEAAWILLLSYAIYDGALEVARDKGRLASAWAFIGLVLVGAPSTAFAAGRLVQWMRTHRGYRR